MLSFLKNSWTWLKQKWLAFEVWVAKKVPGWKTQIIMALGYMSTAFASLQQTVTGLPLEEFITARSIAGMTLGLFVLGAFTKYLSNKYNA